MRMFLGNKVAYHNLAVYFRVNPRGKNLQQKLRRLNWTNILDRSTNQPLFPAVFTVLKFLLTNRTRLISFLDDLMKSCDLACTAPHLDAPKSKTS